MKRHSILRFFVVYLLIVVIRRITGIPSKSLFEEFGLIDLIRDLAMFFIAHLVVDKVFKITKRTAELT